MRNAVVCLYMKVVKDGITERRVKDKMVGLYWYKLYKVQIQLKEEPRFYFYRDKCPALPLLVQSSPISEISKTFNPLIQNYFDLSISFNGEKNSRELTSFTQQDYSLASETDNRDQIAHPHFSQFAPDPARRQTDNPHSRQMSLSTAAVAYPLPPIAAFAIPSLEAVFASLV